MPMPGESDEGLADGRVTNAEAIGQLLRDEMFADAANGPGTRRPAAIARWFAVAGRDGSAGVSGSREAGAGWSPTCGGAS